MDYILGVTTLLVNFNLGWSKGAWWGWYLWAVNAMGWQWFAMTHDLMGLTILNLVTIGTGLFKGTRELHKK